MASYSILQEISCAAASSNVSNERVLHTSQVHLSTYVCLAASCPCAVVAAAAAAVAALVEWCDFEGAGCRFKGEVNDINGMGEKVDDLTAKFEFDKNMDKV